MWDMFGFYLALLSYDSCSIYKERTVFWAFYQQASYYVLCAYQFSSVAQSCLFVTAWTAARQASLSITNSRSLLKLMSIELVMPSNHLILCDLYAYTVNRIKIWSFP